MKKGEIVSGIVERIDFPNKGIVRIDSNEGEAYQATVKNALPGQKISMRISKKKHGKIEGQLLSVEKESPLCNADACSHKAACGGCLYQGMAYEEQLKIKEGQVQRLIMPILGEERFALINEGIVGSPKIDGYRNKMELSFGDNEPGGELCLGMHRRGSFYDIVNTTECRIMDADMCRVLQITLAYFRERSLTYYHKKSHQGYLRHLLLRKTAKTQEILIDLVTSTDYSFREDARQIDGSLTEGDLLEEWMNALLEESFEGRIVGILHTRNDRPADVIEDQGTEILFGRDYMMEELLDLGFKITPFSFFQTNSLGAEVLYTKAREYILGDNPVEGEPFSTVFDLYSGTGTIAQILSPAAKEIVGVEIVPEAVEAAKENAKANGLDNCRFLCGDVLQVLDGVEDKPDMIILDPPRDGIHPKAMPKILAYGVDRILYISCKATSLARDLPFFMEAGYEPTRLCMVDMFPMTGNVESCVLLERVSNRKADSYVKLNVKMEDYYRIKDAEGGEADG